MLLKLERVSWPRGCSIPNFERTAASPRKYYEQGNGDFSGIYLTLDLPSECGWTGRESMLCRVEELTLIQIKFFRWSKKPNCYQQ